MVRFQLRLVDENQNIIEQPRYDVFSKLSSEVAYPILLKNTYVDVAWGYAYRKTFFLQNNFQYAKGKIHEDLGLTHLILIKANYISSIPYIGYNYVQRKGSIMTLKNRKQNLRKVYDTLYHFDNYISILEKDSSIVPSNKKCLTKYLIEILIYKANSLEKEDLDQYIKELKKRKIYRLLPNDTKKDKLRRLFVKYALRAYIYKNMK